MRPSRTILSLLKCPFLRLMSLYQGSTKRTMATTMPAINPIMAPPKRPVLPADVLPRKRPPKRMPKNATTPRSGERIHRADMMSSVSRLMRTASVIAFFPSWDAIGAVKCVESTILETIKVRRIELEDSYLKHDRSSRLLLESRSNHSTINWNHCPGDVTGLVTCQKCHEIAYLVRRPIPSEGHIDEGLFHRIIDALSCSP